MKLLFACPLLFILSAAQAENLPRHPEFADGHFAREVSVRTLTRGEGVICYLDSGCINPYSYVETVPLCPGTGSYRYAGDPQCHRR